MATTVKQLLQGKPTEVWAVSPDDTVEQVLRKLIDKNIGALPVVDDGRLCGIVSERDYARRMILSDKASLSQPVKEIMTSRVTYVRLDQTLDDCMALMTDKRIRHLPVLEDDKLVGIISIGDVVKAIISRQEFMIKQLENYIVGQV